MTNRVSHSSTVGSTSPPSCQCLTRAAHHRRRRPGSASSSCSSQSRPALSHRRPTSSSTMLLRAGLVMMLVAGARAGAVADPPDLSSSQPPPLEIGIGAAAVAAADMIAVPPAAPTIPFLTGHVEHELQLQTDHQESPIAVTHFTRQMDLVKREPNPVEETSDMIVRNDKSDAATTSSAADSPTGTSSSNSSSSISTLTSTASVPTSSSTSSSSSASSSPLPEPFDGAPATIFQSSSSTSDSCPTFMKNLLDNSTFKSCYPLSMMLRTSTSFFEAEKQLVSIVRVLDATCAADVNTCDQFLTQAAKNLIDASNCKKEYDDNQEKVTEAYNGLRAYKILYSATCLQNPHTQTYCFASAVTNITNPSDIFFYSMPLGLALPGGSTPSCGWCTSQTMAIFHAAASDRSQQISSTYKDAARQVNTICGPAFVNDTATSGASRPMAPSADATRSMLATVLFASLTCLGIMPW